VISSDRSVWHGMRESREPFTSASRSAPVGAPCWSSITVSSSRSAASFNIVRAKLCRARRIPACTKDEVRTARGADQFFAFQFLRP